MGEGEGSEEDGLTQVRCRTSDQLNGFVFGRCFVLNHRYTTPRSESQTFFMPLNSYQNPPESEELGVRWILAESARAEPV
jgi:hypothetical protein